MGLSGWFKKLYTIVLINFTTELKMLVHFYQTDTLKSQLNLLCGFVIKEMTEGAHETPFFCNVEKE